MNLHWLKERDNVLVHMKSHLLLGWVQRKLRRLGYKKMELDHQFSKDNLVGKRKIQWTTWGGKSLVERMGF